MHPLREKNQSEGILQGCLYSELEAKYKINLRSMVKNNIQFITQDASFSSFSVKTNQFLTINFPTK